MGRGEVGVKLDKFLLSCKEFHTCSNLNNPTPTPKNHEIKSYTGYSYIWLFSRVVFSSRKAPHFLFNFMNGCWGPYLSYTCGVFHFTN